MKNGLWFLVMSASFLSPVLCIADDKKDVGKEEGEGNNEVLKATRVEVLGEILRGRLHTLLGRTNASVDLVFLIDASSSVGPDNFSSELRFVRKVLAGLQVSAHHARVSVVTFATEAVTHVDSVSEGLVGHALATFRQKCYILEKALPAISYSGGGTFTLGAFIEAQRILKRARNGTSRAVFLLTDGYSNGGDPRVAAKIVREKFGAEVFTFGVRNGNTQELLAMATSADHCYVLNTFQQFAALARRALHQDLRASDAYELQDDFACSALCEGPSCCDPSAQCACNIATGRSVCLCPPGHYGSGLGGDCHLCPSGTFGATHALQSGDVQVSLHCTPCPDPNQESQEGATSADQCTCKNGFTASGSTHCQVSECPELKPPRFGSFVRSKCPRVFNAACGVTCETGRQLIGSSIRLCRGNGTWSGKSPVCRKKRCPELTAPSNGWVRCNGELEVDARCEIGCEEGYIVLGSRHRNCLAIGMWDGLPTSCREVKCPALELPKSVSVSPKNCLNGKQRIGQVCKISCNQQGYQLRGASRRKCGEYGRWSGSRIQCVDIQPPTIACPNEIFEFPTDPDLDYATVALALPEIDDNSNDRVRIHITPTVHLHSGQLPLGVSPITIQATDLAGNFATCAFNITIIDTQPPRIESCDSPPIFMIPANIHAVDITWNAPVFSDNSGLDIKVFASHESGTLFTPGTHNVNYVAYDKARNNATCQITIVVQRTECEGPLNGDKVCNGSVCTLSCDEGYDLAITTTNFCESLTNGSYPDCTIIDLPDSIEQNFGVDFDECDEEQSNDLTDLLSSTVRMACTADFNCHLEKVSGCGDDMETDVKDIEEQESNVISVRTTREIKQMRGKGSKRGSKEFTLIGNHNEFKIKIVGKLKASSKSESLRSALGTVRALLVSGSFTTSQRLPALEMKFSDPHLGCPAGSVLRLSDLCVQCPRGTFLPANNKECVICPAGSFQSKPGELKCEICPKGTSTIAGILATKKQHCVELCQPGFWSKNGVLPCVRCPLGSYQPKHGQQGCISCSEGYSTAGKGASSESLCTPLCAENSISRNGLEPCFACPQSFKQILKGQKMCEHESCATGQCQYTALYAMHPCVRQKPCSATAACVPSSPTAHSYQCKCRLGWQGNFCDELDEDPCLSKPCTNGVTCQRNGTKFQCICRVGFTGQYCEEDINECENEPCLNFGVCLDLPGSYSCVCVPGYSGASCETISSPCQALQPCLSDAKCFDNFENSSIGYRCECPLGRNGTQCEETSNPCSQVNCQNGGTCLPDPTTDAGISLAASCICLEPFSGDRCETSSGACKTFPCLNGGECTLVQAAPGYKCQCPANFAGDNCSVALLDDGVLQFRNYGNLRDYVLKENALNASLTEFTLCSWLRTRDTINYGTPLSYATNIQDNTLALTDYSGFVVYINGERVVTDVSANDGLWHLVCLLWSSQDGSWSLYKDGVKAESGDGLATKTSIPGGGTLVLGQEQDSPGGSFNSEQSFLGRLGPTAMWPNLLSELQLAAIYEDCSSHRSGPISSVSLAGGGAPALWSWKDTLAGIKGNLQLEPPEFCAGCPDLPKLFNGNVNSNGTEPGNEATFTCSDGFRISGAISAVCNKRGTWQLRGHKPICLRVRCRTPDSLENGLVLGNSYDYGATIFYECFPGFNIVNGDANRECLATGRWSGSQPDCKEVTCKIPLIRAAHIHHYGSKEDLPGSQVNCPVGEQIEVHCYEGLIQKGPNLLMCLDTGLWDHEPPQCHSACNDSPPEIENSNAVLVLGTKARYSCLPGYSIVGNPLVECKEEWGVAPECQMKKSCETAPDVENGKLESFSAGIAIYTCETGYAISGVETIRCMDGEWSPPPPQCIQSGCLMPPALEKGSIKVKSLERGGIAEHACDAGLQLVGPRLRKCLGTRWSSYAPYCKPVA